VEPLEKLYQTWTLLYLYARNDLLDILGYVYVLFAVMVIMRYGYGLSLFQLLSLLELVDNPQYTIPSCWC
jgi:hypothetical protein